MGTTRSSSWRYEVQVAPGETPSQIDVASGGERDGARGAYGRARHRPAVRGRRPLPHAVRLDGSPARANGQPDPDRYHVHDPGRRPRRGRDGRHGSTRRVPPRGPEPGARIAHGALELDRGARRCSPPSAPEGRTLSWWPRPTAPSTPTAPTGRICRGGRSRQRPTPAITPARRHTPQEPSPRCRAGRSSEASPSATWPTPRGPTSTSWPPT